MSTLKFAANISSVAGVFNLGISQAREMISPLVAYIGSSTDVATIGPRNNPTAVLVSYDRLKSLIKGNQKERIAFCIVENLLDQAPLHIRNPQIKELSKQNLDDLIVLMTIDKFPLSPKQLEELKSKLIHPIILDRLLRSYQLANAIAEAEREGLYEANEHFTSDIDFE